MMGMAMGFSRCSCSCERRVPAPKRQPDPSRYDMLRYASYGDVTVVEVVYEGCTNYEGRKILVLQGWNPQAGGPLDPHFCDRDTYRVLARFEPTKRGWEWAVSFARYVRLT